MWNLIFSYCFLFAAFLFSLHNSFLSLWREEVSWLEVHFKVLQYNKSLEIINRRFLASSLYSFFFLWCQLNLLSESDRHSSVWAKDLKFRLGPQVLSLRNRIFRSNGTDVCNHRVLGRLYFESLKFSGPEAVTHITWSVPVILPWYSVPLECCEVSCTGYEF